MTLPDVRLVTSEYAIEEARRNLPHPEQFVQLDYLIARMQVLAEVPEGALPEWVTLPSKDRPILHAAIRAGATHLLTGDIQHFGAYLGRAIAGIRILLSGAYLRERSS